MSTIAPVTPRRALATPTDYERVGVSPLSPGLLYRDRLASLDSDTRGDLAAVLGQPGRHARTMLTHRRIAAQMRQHYKRSRPLDTTATVPEWEGMAQ